MSVLARIHEWATEHLAYLWIPIIAILITMITALTFGPCTSDRCRLAQERLEYALTLTK